MTHEGSLAAVDYSKKNRQHKPFYYKAVVAVLMVCCLVIGVLGLLLPIIPGLVFLFIAAFLLARLSGRFESLLHRHATLSRWSRKLDSANSLPVSQRAKLLFWVSAGGIVNGLNSLYKRINKPAQS